MGKFRTGAAPGQVMLMPADPRDWLPAGHLAWKVLEQAGEMDLSLFGARYRADGQGGRPYDPQMMATLLLYCYCRGRRSSREIEMATFDDVGARVICGGLHPDHSTVAEFVRRNVPAILALLPASVKACAAEGLVPVEVVAGDGTKLKANASRAANATRGQLDAQIAELQAAADAEFRAWVQDMLGEDRPVPPGGGRTDGGTAGKARPKRPAQVLAKRRQASAVLDARRQDATGKQQAELAARVAELAARLEKKEASAARREQQVQARLDERARRAAAGQKIPGRAPITSAGQDRDLRELHRSCDKTRRQLREAAAAAAAPPAGPDAKINTTDPASAVMPMKNGGFAQARNVQALATARTQVILAILDHPSPVDMHALQPLMEQARAVLDAAGITDDIRKALFDAGYASDANFRLDLGALLYIAVTREARQAGRSADGRSPATMLPSWDDMTARLATDEGRALYRQRAATIEPVFAQLVARLGRTLHYRGDLVNTELALWAATHNTLKAIKARSRRTAAQAPAPAAA
jgi:transposase